MKAIILAAGKGERLREMSLGIPKTMIRYRGKPVLEHNIELCQQFGISEIFINTHHQSEAISNYFGDGSRFGVSILYSREEILLGTSGAVRYFRQQLENDPFFVIYGDNYSDFDLNLLQQEYHARMAMGIIGFHWRDDTSASGVAEFSADGRITNFVEKPTIGENDSHWVNAGLYFLNPEIMSYIPDGFSDFAKDIFPKLLVAGERLYGVCSKADVRAFDTPEMYNRSMNLDE